MSKVIQQFLFLLNFQNAESFMNIHLRSKCLIFSLILPVETNFNPLWENVQLFCTMRNNKRILDQILELTDDNELRAAIRKYARSEKDFFYHLQVSFLHLIPSDQPAEKYTAFLSSCFRTWLDRPDRINKTVAKKISGITEELRQQSLDMISTKNYIEAYGILKNLLLYNSLLIEKTYPHSPEALLINHRDILSTWKKMSLLLLPRPLIEEMINELGNLITTGSVKLIETEINALDVLTSLLVEEKRREKLFNEFLNFLTNQPPKSLLREKSVKSLLINTVIHSEHNWAEKLYNAGVISNTALYEQCEIWLNKGQTAQSLKLCQNCMDFLSAGNQSPFLELMTRLQIAEGKFEQALDHLITFASDRHTPHKILARTLENTPEKFRQYALKNLKASEVIQRMSGKRETLLLAYVMVWLRYTEELMTIAEDQKFPELLMPFNKILFKECKKELIRFYQDYLDEYLSTHIGSMSINFTSKLLDEIRKSGAGELSRILSDFISKKYSYRKSVSQLEP